jgi:hypothetical protein
MKICRKCGAEKSTQCYNKDSRQSDGLDRLCRACSRAYQRERYTATHKRHPKIGQTIAGEKKGCSACYTWKPLADFGACKTFPTGLASWCKDCARIRNKAHYHKDLQKSRARSRKVPRSPEEYNALVQSQGNRCAICLTDKPGGPGSWKSDHNHTTEQARGLLCQKCNIGIGHLKDSTEVLRAAIAYLDHWTVQSAKSKSVVPQNR